MANRANVDALAALVVAWPGFGEWDGEFVPAQAQQFAEWLVAQPTPPLVIADAVLTPKHVKRMDPGNTCINGAAPDEVCGECAEAYRRALSRLARGEATT